MREIGFHEIPEEESAKSNPWVGDANEIAQSRLQQKEQPEAGLEVGLESESGFNDQQQKKEQRPQYMSSDEIAMRRIQREKDDMQQANEIRKKLGIPTKGE